MSSYAREIAFIGIVLFTIFSFVHADVAPWRACPQDADAPNNCTVHEVRINPCKEAAQGKPCRLKRGSNASIEFDYTVNFEAASLEGSAYWVNPVVEVPFMGMETNGCLGTPCPSSPDTRQTYHQGFPISRKYPARTYDVKWMLSSPEGQHCCFIFQIKIFG